ncbi:PKD domain-containing protein [Sphingobacterium spiritivorum]|nr:PKD domain-containing protein [Sphingobacterium spiritivorum]QQS98012.1 PKD domain-containing protein [Sphingobacterium spiritivorum]
MKTVKFLYLFIGLVILGCSKDEITGIGQQGEYIANFDFPEYAITAPAKVVLTNRSKNADRFQWQFEGAKIIDSKGKVQDVTTSEKMVPDTIFYELPGEYSVSLTTWQGDQKKEITKKIVIPKMQPKINVPENIAVYTDVQFSASIFTYPGKTVTYSWDFGNGVVSDLEKPVIKFTKEGSQIVKLTVNDGVETLTTEVAVDVKGELAKTIYFTDVITKKIYKYKLTTLAPSTVVDLGITTGVSPLGLSIGNGKVYLSDAGLGLRFSTGTNANGDGFVKYFNLDGTGETFLTKRSVVGASEYNLDPWMNAVDSDGNVWWTSRNNGVYVAAGGGVEIPYPNFKFRPTATNIPGFSSSTHFYSGIKEVNGEIWVSFTGTAGVGIHKFSKAGAFIGSLSGTIKSLGVRQFVVDQVNKQIYFAINRGGTYIPGIYRSDMDGNNIVAVYNDPAVMGFTATGFSDQGYVAPDNTNETIYVTGMDIDVDETGKGYLYFGYRNKADASGANAPQTVGSGSKSGVLRYKLGTSETPEFIIKGYAPYGIAIDQVKR